MPFTTPLALLGLLFIPAVIAMYLLKLRRDEAVVPSTLLWTRLVADVEANAPWQKLRRSLLLLLQLLLVVILALLAARPFLERPAGLARDIVLVMDTSASMAATDVAPDRLTAAKQAAIEALQDLPTGGKVSVIAADRSARIVVNESTRPEPGPPGDRGASRSRQRSGDLGDALELASKLAARSGDAAGPRRDRRGAGDRARPAAVDAPVKVLPVGRDRKNQAIVALAVRTVAVGRHALGVRQRRQPRPRARAAPARAVGRRPPARGPRRRSSTPQARSDVDHRRPPARRRHGRGPPGRQRSGRDDARPDQLAVDDRAWAVIPPDRTRLILVVGEGDPYLETALSLPARTSSCTA